MMVWANIAFDRYFRILNLFFPVSSKYPYRLAPSISTSFPSAAYKKATGYEVSSPSTVCIPVGVPHSIISSK